MSRGPKQKGVSRRVYLPPTFGSSFRVGARRSGNLSSLFPPSLIRNVHMSVVAFTEKRPSFGRPRWIVLRTP
jgi:hypothetical protein